MILTLVSFVLFHEHEHTTIVNKVNKATTTENKTEHDNEQKEQPQQ